MERIIHAAVSGLAAVLVLTGTVAAKPSSGNQRVERTIPRLGTTDGSAVVLASKPGSEADRLARQLMAREIDRAHADGADPLVLVGMARVNDEDELLFVQLQSLGECGSGGCSTASFIHMDGRWVRIMDTISGTVRIAGVRHHGMPDLVIDRSHFVWDGTQYRDLG